MWTKTFVCAAALMIAGPVFVYAQQGPGEPHHDACTRPGQKFPHVSSKIGTHGGFLY